MGSENKTRALMQSALKEISALKKEVAALRKTRNEPIAVVGMSCRYPGGINNPEAYWEALAEGRDCINYDGAGRWDMDALFDENPETPGKIYTKAMGAIDSPELFDAEFFGISPREAEAIDPQHRILLETCHDAMEHAGIASDRLAGSKSGVFVGISSTDYAQLGTLFGNAEALSPWHGTGNALSAAAGRISYLYDFKGPCISVDTACSSSLVAMHYACQSLRQGDCDMALAGGVHLVLNPATTIIFSKARMLAPDGRCKTFSADADGYVRSEGCGVVVLKRLSDAVSNGDNILATIRGSAVNQDGKSQGLTAPNEAAQEAVIEAALEQAKLKPSQVSYVEAHGTGTALGDPIELNALHHVYEQERPTNKPLHLGSVKTNFGHSEAASGVAGVIKTVLSLQAKRLPMHLHFAEPNPYVDWSAMKFKVLAEAEDWDSKVTDDGVRRGAVSAFGFTGTNAHLILEEYQREDLTEGSEQKWEPSLLTVSAKKPEALLQVKEHLLEFLKNESDVELADIIYSQNLGRNQYKFREAYLVENRESLIQQLSNNDEANTGKKKKPGLKVALVVDLEPSAYIPLVNSLLNTSKVFNDHLGQALNRVVTILGDDSELNNENIKQFWEENLVETEASDHWVEFTALYALVKSLIDWGIKPNMVLGHGFGSYVMAIVAGILKLEDVLTILSNASKGNNDTLKIKSPRIPYVCGDCGKRFTAAEKAFAYWEKRLSSDEERQESMQTVLDYDADITVVVGGVSPTAEDNEKVVYIEIENSQKLQQGLASAFCNGIDLNWNKFYEGLERKKISLPTYPYLRKRHWSRELDLVQEQKDSTDVEKLLLESSYKVDWTDIELSDAQNIDSTETLFSGFNSKDSQWNLISFSRRVGISSEKVASHLEIYIDEQKNCIILNGETFSCNSDEFSALHSALALFLHDEVIEQSLQLVTDSNSTQSGGTIVSLIGIKAESNPDLVTFFMLALAKALHEKRASKVYFLTEMGYQVLDQEQLTNQNQSLAAGFIKSMMLEMPDKVYGHLDYDYDPLSEGGNLESIFVPLHSLIRFPPIAQRSNQWLQSLLNREVIEETQELSNNSGVNIKSNSPYLIIGGTGSLGIQIANSLVALGARHLQLMSRTGAMSDASAGMVAQMEQSGVKVDVIKLDVADQSAVKKWLSELEAATRPVGIVHAAGVYDITPISELTFTHCQNVMESKVQGLKNLDEAFPVSSLEFFIGFSSIASVWGSAGNFHYSAANHYLDGLLQKRRQQGEFTKTFNWGPWADSNMVNDETSALAEKRGLHQLDKTAGMALFSKLLSVESSQHVIANINWQKFKRVMELTAMGAMFNEIKDSSEKISKNSSDSASESVEISVELTESDIAFSEALANADETEKPALLLNYLAEQLAIALQLEAEDIDEYAPLISLGIDSLMALEFRDRLRKVSSVEVPFVKLMEGASLVDISHLVTELDDGADEEALELVVEGAI